MNEEDRSAPTRIMTAAQVADAELAASRAATTDRLPASPSRAIVDDLPTPTPRTRADVVPMPMPMPGGAPPDSRPQIWPASVLGAPAVKPGWRTSELWLGIAAIALSAVYGAGALTSSTAITIAAIAANILGALGYTVSRTVVKARA